jgi:hypothetical protein
MILMINLSLIKGKVVAVHDIDDLLAQSVGIIAFSCYQGEPGLCCSRFNAKIRRMIHTSRESNETAILRTPVIGIDAVWLFVRVRA